MKKSKIKDIDHGWKNALKQIKTVGGKSVRVGVLSTAGKSDDGASLAEIAFWQEFGTKSIPERSFLRTTIDENRAKYVSFIFKNMQKVLAGKIKGKTALNRLGMMAQGDVRKKMKDIKTPALSNTTIELRRMRAGGDHRTGIQPVVEAYNAGQSETFKKPSITEANPLIDTGSLLRSIDYEVKT